MKSLRTLVEKHGIGIHVKSARNYREFRIIEELDDSHYLVEYQDGKRLKVLKECSGCDDYDLVLEGWQRGLLHLS